MSIIYVNPYSFAGIVTDGLLLHLDAGNSTSYPGSGTTWTDLSGNGNTGTLTNGPTFNSANSGSIVFDGSNDCVLVSPTNFNLLEFTVNMWFKSDDIVTDYRRLIQKSDTTGSTKGFVIASSANNGKLVFVYQPNYQTSEVLRRSTTLVSTGVWLHTSMTYNSSSGMKIYFNGVEDAGETATAEDIGWAADTGNFFSIGSRAGSSTSFYDGNIAQVSVYNRALSATEVTQNFNALRGRFGL